MKNNKYIGHDSQLFGVEQSRLVGGKGDGMHLLHIKNGLGLEFTVSADRCADISRLSYNGSNYGYFSPSGYVAPQYYDDKGIGFLKSFTAGFLTTCGLTAVGSPCKDNEQELPLHGTISNCPAETISSEVTDSEIIIKATINQAGIFADKLMLYRTITCSLEKNVIMIEDRIKNIGDEKTALMLLYHMNMGYPLLSEEAKIFIPSKEVKARNAHAQKDINSWDKMLPPTAGFEEQCYFHSFEEKGLAAIYNPVLKKGLVIQFDSNVLDHFTEWKMMGVKDYVLGLEPGNCHPNGRDKMREEGKLKYILPDEEIVYRVNLSIIEDESQWKSWKSF